MKGVGEVVKKSRSVDALHGISAEVSMNVVLAQGAVQNGAVEAQANLIELPETKRMNVIGEITTKNA